MICCAERCRNRSCSPIGNNNDTSYLTFGDYSVYASEMKRAYEEDSATATAPPSKIPHKCPIAPASGSKSNNHSTINCNVFLGGSCNPTTWRQDTAIPMLKNLGITYYNPQVSSWRPELIELEHQAKTNAEILFFVVNSQTRATAAVIEVAYLVSKQRKVILVVSGFKGPGQKICNEPITEKEYEELTCSQLLLQDLVERHGVQVYNDIQNALHCTAKVLRDNIHPQDFSIPDLAQPSKMDHLQNSNLKLWICSHLNLKKTFDSLDTAHNGEISLTDFPRAFRILLNRELKRDEVIHILENNKKRDKNISSLTPQSSTIEPNLKEDSSVINDTTLNFDQFCCMMTELIYHHHHHNFNSAWSNHHDNKTSNYIHNISHALTCLLEIIPGSKSCWVLSSTPETEARRFPSHDVYLGGPSTTKNLWRSDVAIPLLKKHGLTFINPVIRQRNTKLFPTDIFEIPKCRIIFFYIPQYSRSLESCILAVYYIGLGFQVVLCIEYLKNECQIDGETLTELAVKDYNRGRSYLSDLAIREGVQVFEDITEALECVVASAAVREIP